MIKVGNYVVEESVENILHIIKSQITNGKLRNITKRAGQVCITCPFHSEGREDTPSCYVNENGIFHCFGCHESGNFSKLVGACFDEDEKFGRKWLITNYVGDTIIEQESNKFSDNPFEEENKEFIDESILDSFEKWHPYLEKRHLNSNVCEQFKVRYDSQKEMIVFPVWDEHNRLYMLTRRSVKDKTFIIDKNKEKPVYLLNYIIKQGITKVLVVESQINALTAWTWNIPAVALFGTGTKYQYDILNKSGIRQYVLAFDGDEAGKKATEKFIKNCKSDAYIEVVTIPKGKDVNDLTEEEFRNLSRQTSFEWLLNNC